MDGLRFEWDPEKNEINKIKHQISFEEAKTVFYDDEAKVIDDPEHSEEEERFIILGLSKKPICWWFVIAIGHQKLRFGSFQRGKRQGQRQNNIFIRRYPYA